MPTKNDSIALSAGTLYIRHPETGGTLPCGTLKSIELTQTRTEYVDELGIVDPCIATPPMECTLTIETDADSVYLLALRMAAGIQSCVTWARNERPHLVHLAVHAKKRRTRKKNTVRIVREYLKE